MIIITGLGNPGEKFKNTRHNVGFMAIDLFAGKNDFPDFKLQKKSNALITEKLINEEKIILAKPQTFMNESGKAVQAIEKPYKTEPKLLTVVIHDDIDLPVGKMKIVKERGSAGHKGVESIIQRVGNDGLIRIRIGIGGKKDTEAKKVVLKNFSKEEAVLINEVLQRTAEALSLLIEEGLDKAMNKFNS